MTRRLLLFLFPFAGRLFAQQGKGVFVAEKETVLAGAAEVLTVHLPSTSTRTVAFTEGWVYCSVACTFTLERDGTAPTTTPLTVKKVNANISGDTAASNDALAFHTSNVGASTVLNTYNVPAGGTFPIDLSDKGLLPGENLTLRTSSITGTARLTLKWKE